MKISTPVRVGHLSGAAHGPKFKIPLPRSCVPKPTEYTCQVSSTSAQRSQPQRVMKMLTPHNGHLTGFTSHLVRYIIIIIIIIIFMFVYQAVSTQLVQYNLTIIKK